MSEVIDETTSVTTYRIEKRCDGFWYALYECECGSSADVGGPFQTEEEAEEACK